MSRRFSSSKGAKGQMVDWSNPCIWKWPETRSNHSWPLFHGRGKALPWFTEELCAMKSQGSRKFMQTLTKHGMKLIPNMGWKPTPQQQRRLSSLQPLHQRKAVQLSWSVLFRACCIWPLRGIRRNTWLFTATNLPRTSQIKSLTYVTTWTLH